MLYDLESNALNIAYDIDGESLDIAYDMEGNAVFSSEIPIITPSVDYTQYSFTQKWASKGISSTQGFDIYDDKVFWVSKSGNATVPSNCYVWNLSDGSQALDIAYITVYSGHGNNLCFDFPNLYASTAYSDKKVYINEISNDFLTCALQKTLVLMGDYGNDVCLDDENSNILWSIEHTSTASDASLSPYYIVRQWDLRSLTDNQDGTYTPRLIRSVQTSMEDNFYFQGCCMHDGIFWYATGYSDSSNANVYGINPYTGEVLYTIDCETTAEPEGIKFYPDANGGYAMYVGFAGMMMREYTFKGLYEDKTLSILGDSISTYIGYIPSGNANFYNGSNCGVSSVNDTWWMKLINALGMTLNVNNSWSGSRVTTTSSSTSAGCMTRCQDLGTNPDVIIVYMGINDFNNEVALGTYDGSGTLPSTTTTFREAYAIMLNKIKTAYPTSEIWCATLPPCERNGTVGAPEINDNGVPLTDFNDAIRELAHAFDLNVLNHDNCGITYENMSTYMGDWDSGTGRALHPNASGHSLIANNDIHQLDASCTTSY